MDGRCKSFPPVDCVTVTIKCRDGMREWSDAQRKEYIDSARNRVAQAMNLSAQRVEAKLTIDNASSRESSLPGSAEAAFIDPDLYYTMKEFQAITGLDDAQKEYYHRAFSKKPEMIGGRRIWLDKYLTGSLDNSRCRKSYAGWFLLEFTSTAAVESGRRPGRPARGVERIFALAKDAVTLSTAPTNAGARR